MYICIYNIFGNMKMKNDRSTHDTTLLVSQQLEQKAQVSEGSTEVALLCVRDKALTLHLKLQGVEFMCKITVIPVSRVLITLWPYRC